ncbi:hypothetical protein SHVI106290_15600 [Shewanella violacea]
MYTNKRCTWQEMFLYFCAFLSSMIVRVLIPGVQEVLKGGLCLGINILLWMSPSCFIPSAALHYLSS